MPEYLDQILAPSPSPLSRGVPRGNFLDVMAQGIGEYQNARAAERTQSVWGRMAAERFRSLVDEQGQVFPDAERMARMLEVNPRAAYAFGQTFGGLDQVERAYRVQLLNRSTPATAEHGMQAATDRRTMNVDPEFLEQLFRIDPELFREYTQGVYRVGASQQSLGGQPRIQALDPADWTHESWARYLDTGDTRALRRAPRRSSGTSGAQMTKAARIRAAREYVDAIPEDTVRKRLVKQSFMGPNPLYDPWLEEQLQLAMEPLPGDANDTRWRRYQAIARGQQGPGAAPPAIGDDERYSATPDDEAAAAAYLKSMGLAE